MGTCKITEGGVLRIMKKHPTEDGVGGAAAWTPSVAQGLYDV